MRVNRWLCLFLALALANAARADWVSAIGGTVSNIPGYRIHTFTSSGIFSVSAPGNVEVLVVAGGGGGGGSTGGGGGAGGYLSTNGFAVANGGSYTVTVGAGGAGGSDTPSWTRGSNGGDSSFGSLTNKGGGGGGCNQGGSANFPGQVGGSGGGGTGSGSQAGGLGTIGQGKNGGTANAWPSGPIHAGGGGGGAGSDGTNGPTSGTVGASGGNGLSNSISGTLQWYAGGGGGGVYGATTASAGGSGLGGSGGGGSGSSSPLATSGAANTGSGGGGQGGNGNTSAGSGGSGIVIVRYALKTTAPGAPAVDNANGATNVTLTSAWLNGTLVSTGTSDAAISVFWGPSDGGTNGGPIYWANTNTWDAPQPPGSFTTNVTGLSSNTTYYYQFAASNTADRSWSGFSVPFMTSPVWVERASDAAEQGLITGTFTFHRASSTTNAAITVSYTVGGSAVAGLDYINNLAGTVTFAPGASNATVVVTPLLNNASNSDSTVSLTINPGAYVVGDPASATMTITNWALPASPATFYVNVSGGDNTRVPQLAANPATPWRTITYALSQVSSGDVINVAAGAYNATTEAFPLTMKNGVTLQGAGFLRTTIDAGFVRSRRVFTCSGVTNGLIDGFTIQGGYDDVGAGAIYMLNSSLTISNNRFTRNWSDSGAPDIFRCDGGAPRIVNNLIVGNGGGSTRSGILIQNSSTPLFVNNTIVGNYSQAYQWDGGVIVVNGGTPSIKNCIIWNNAKNMVNVTSNMINNSCVGGTFGSVTADTGSPGVNGNISSDPLFANGYFLSQTAAGQSQNSPCAGTGTGTPGSWGLGSLTTRSDMQADANAAVDMGFHFPTNGYVAGAQVYVNVGSGNDGNTGDATHPWKSITHALAVAATNGLGWTINVATGTYNNATESFPLNLVDTIALQGAGYLTTTIAGPGSNPTWLIYGQGTVRGKLDGFTLTGGYSDGGACLYFYNSSLDITRNRIRNNRANQGGATGIFVVNAGAPWIANNLIISNRASRGAGIDVPCGAPMIENNTLATNIAEGVSYNSGAINFSQQPPAVPLPVIRNCIVWSNTVNLTGVDSSTISCSCVGGGGGDGYTGVSGNINTDPQFVGPPTSSFRLSAGSPCINTGTNQSWMATATDLDGNPRLSGASPSTRLVDMGAYEYQYLVRHGMTVFFQ